MIQKVQIEKAIANILAIWFYLFKLSNQSIVVMWANHSSLAKIHRKASSTLLGVAWAAVVNRWSGFAALYELVAAEEDAMTATIGFGKFNDVGDINARINIFCWRLVVMTLQKIANLCFGAQLDSRVTSVKGRWLISLRPRF